MYVVILRWFSRNLEHELFEDNSKTFRIVFFYCIRTQVTLGKYDVRRFGRKKTQVLNSMK